MYSPSWKYTRVYAIFMIDTMEYVRTMNLWNELIEH
jgi:hypothetical protein